MTLRSDAGSLSAVGFERWGPPWCLNAVRMHVSILFQFYETLRLQELQLCLVFSERSLRTLGFTFPGKWKGPLLLRNPSKRTASELLESACLPFDSAQVGLVAFLLACTWPWTVPTGARNLPKFCQERNKMASRQERPDSCPCLPGLAHAILLGRQRPRLPCTGSALGAVTCYASFSWAQLSALPWSGERPK